MPKSGASTYLNHRVIMGVDGYVVSHLAAIVANEKEVLTEFLYEVLTLIKAQDMKVNTDYPSLNVGDIESLKIPLPPKKIQTQIIAECQKIDQEYETSRMSIEAYRAKIAKIFSDLEVMAQNQSGGVKLLKIKELCINLFAGGDVPKENFTEIPTAKNTVPIFSNGIGNKALYGYTDIAKVNQDAITISARGTIGYVAIRKAPFFPIVRLIVAIPNSKMVEIKYLKHILERTEINSSGGTIPQLTVPMIKDVLVPIPSIAKQQTILAQIAEYEAEIAKLEQNLQDLPKRKQAVLDKYLN